VVRVAPYLIFDRIENMAMSERINVRAIELYSCLTTIRFTWKMEKKTKTP